MKWIQVEEDLPKSRDNFTKSSRDVIIYAPSIGVDIGSYYNNGDSSFWFHKGQSCSDVTH